MTEHNGNGKTYIYGLQDPRDGQFYYIGKSDTPETRLQQHLKDRTSNRDKVAWLDGLKVAGLEPELIILEKTDMQKWGEAERRWIANGHMDGWPLTNIQRGGSGTGSGSQDCSFMFSYLGPDLYPQFAALPFPEKKRICTETAQAMVNSYQPLLEHKMQTHQGIMHSLIDDEEFGIGSQVAQEAVTRAAILHMEFCYG